MGTTIAGSAGPRGILWGTALIGSVLVATPGGAQQQLPEAQVQRIEVRLDSLVESLMVERQIPGATVVVVGNGRVLLREGWGVADVETGRPVDPGRTLFRIGSATKALTGLAVLRLLAKGALELDAPVRDYLDLDALASDRFAEPVRVRHLLEHTAGFDQRGVGRQVASPVARPSLNAFLASELIRVRPPGAVPVYDTYGITLAGHLVERVSGRTYSDFMRDELFRPLGMTRTAVEAPDSLRDHLARGYGLEDGRLVEQDYEWYVTLPASSIDATGDDMGRLLVALLSHGTDASVPVGPETRRLLGTVQHAWPGGLRAFSWGWWEGRRRNLRVLHHGGTMAGYSSELLLVPEAGIGIFVACNRDGETGPDPRLGQDITDALLSWMIPEGRGDVPVEAPSPRTPPADLAAYGGAWASTLGCYTCGEGEGWPLASLGIETEPPATLLLPSQRWYALDPTVFELEDSDRRIAFLEDGEGRIRWFMNGTRSWVRLDEALFADVDGPDWRSEPPSPLQAMAHRAAERWPAAARAYASLAERHPDNGRYPFYHGFSALNGGETDEAVRAFREAERRGQWVGWSIYYQAAARAAEGHAAEALALLARAIEHGFGDSRLLGSDSWWDALRDDPRFVELAESIRAP